MELKQIHPPLRSLSEVEAERNSVDENQTALGVSLESESQLQGLTFNDAVRIARGCFDYGGGYRDDEAKMKVYHHGIQTVLNALEHAERSGLQDLQIAVLHSIGKLTATICATEGCQDEVDGPGDTLCRACKAPRRPIQPSAQYDPESDGTSDASGQGA